MSEKKTVIDMRKYDESKEVVDACAGCENVFDHLLVLEGETGSSTEVVAKKCLVYFDPAAKWPTKGTKFVTKEFVVRKRNANGVAIALANEEHPVCPKICPMATHVKVPEIVETNVKVHVGQGKTKQGGNR